MGGHKQQAQEGQKNVQFRAPVELIDEYRRAVKERERTMAQALRLHMQETVRQSEQEQVAA